MSDQLSDINERLYRLHPNDIQLQTMIQQYSPRSSAEKTVKLCKHCSFAFRTDFNYHESDDYCSKGNTMMSLTPYEGQNVTPLFSNFP